MVPLVTSVYIHDINSYLKRYILDKEVLDVGFADDKGISITLPHWIHKFIRNNAKYVIGLDLDRNAITKLNHHGYNCIFGDAQNFNLHRKFDVIFAGELIEHLENPGQFLDCAKKHLNKGGLLIITTPNQFSIVRFIGNLFGLLHENPEHVLVHNKDTLAHLAKRYRYSLVEQHFL